MKMKLTRKTTITNIKIGITPRVVKSIVGFVDLEIIDKDNKIIFKVRGYTIKVRSFGDNPPIFVVDAPAFRSGFRFKKSFIVEDKSLWFKLEKEILNEFNELTGGKTPNDYLSESQEINIEEISKDLLEQ